MLRLSRNPRIASLALVAGLLLGPLTGCQADNAMQSGLQALPFPVLNAAAGPKQPTLTDDVQIIIIDGQKRNFRFVRGLVTKLLPDDNKGLRHQHFQIRLEDQRTVKVAHNVDLAPYVPVQVNAPVEIRGEYLKSKPVDVLHWTHSNPRAKVREGSAGYIKYNGNIYE